MHLAFAFSSLLARVQESRSEPCSSLTSLPFTATPRSGPKEKGYIDLSFPWLQFQKGQELQQLQKTVEKSPVPLLPGYVEQSQT